MRRFSRELQLQITQKGKLRQSFQLYFCCSKMLVDENKIKKENFYLFAPELAHASDRVGELELGYQVAFCVPSKG